MTAEQLPGDAAYVDAGVMVNSGQFDGLPYDGGQGARSPTGSRQRGIGKRHGQLPPARLADLAAALLGHADPDAVLRARCGIVPVPEERPAGRCCPRTPSSSRPASQPLASSETFVNTTCPMCGGPARRETDTMDTFMDSSWYFLRYARPAATTEPPGFDPRRSHYWLPVDQYMGGAEHAVMHLLYARFFMQVLRDLGLVDVPRAVHAPVQPGRHPGRRTASGCRKSRGNVVNPDDHVERSAPTRCAAT